AYLLDANISPKGSLDTIVLFT
nr:RNA-polymerase-associated transcription specificity factor RAP94 - vaccinia virus (fragments) [Vaccinia virus]